MSRRAVAMTPRLAAPLTALLAASGAHGGAAAAPAQPAPDVAQPRVINGAAVWTDDAADAVIRRTDVIADGDELDYPGVLPDLLSITLRGWDIPASGADRFTGAPVPADGADIFRLDAVFAGLVNPPGTIGLAGRPFEPFLFGPSPLYGFIEIDVDDDRNTGGELGDAALVRFLANAGRFGGVPAGLRGQRLARSAEDYDGSFNTGHQFERSGAEFCLMLCGCHLVTIARELGDGDGVFDAGESWIVSSRFFQRTSGFEGASGAFNGSAPGRYDPLVPLLFTHDADTDRTTVSLVYALTMAGAARLAGQAAQSPNSNVGDHTSIEEAMLDVIDFSAANPPTGATATLVGAWATNDSNAYLNPLTWDLTAIVAVTYPAQQAAHYVYTDVGFGLTTGDLNGDGQAENADVALLQEQIDLLDGSMRDGDGVVNDSVVIIDHAHNFSVFDVTGDGVLGDADLLFYDPNGLMLVGDINLDGVVNATDLALLLGAWGPADETVLADLNGDGVVNSADLALLLGNWGAMSGD